MTERVTRPEARGPRPECRGEFVRAVQPGPRARAVASPLDGRVVFEHGGCAEHSELSRILAAEGGS